MTDKLTKRQLQSLKKAKAKKGQRLQLKEVQRRRAAERAARPRPPRRRKDWWDDDDSQYREERIWAPKPLGRASSLAAAPPEPSRLALATVIEIRAADSLVAHRGRVIRAILPPGGRAVDPTARSRLAVGDQVQTEPIGSGEARIVAVAPRRSALTRDVHDASRSDPTQRGQVQVLAANIDQVIVVCSPAQPPFRPRLIDRYLVAASRDSLTAIICLNKTDLGVPAAVEACLRGYAALGTSVVRTSAVSRAGIDDVKRWTAGRVSVLTGHSGVGKSSLLNALAPGLSLRVGEVTQAAAGQGKGRHITSSARLIPLSLPDTFVVDTPGIRAFGIRGLAPRDLAGHFADIAALAPGCSYRDCFHRGEPGCAVAARAKDDSFLHQRLASYRMMLADLE